MTHLQGDLYNHDSLVKAIKEVDVVISTVGAGQLADQEKLIAAIKEAGNVKVIIIVLYSLIYVKILFQVDFNYGVLCIQRFLPSEFGNDVDRGHAVEPAKSAFTVKVQIRRAVEAAKIPYTYVSSNFFASYFLPSLSQPGATTPPRDKVVILGDGNPKCK